MNIEWFEILRVMGIYLFISILLSVLIGNLFWGGK